MNAALVRKEARLILPGWIVALTLAVIPMWLTPTESFEMWRKGDSGYWILSIWLAFGILWPALSSFGQEFNLGTFSTLLAQPAERSRIWRLKFGVLLVAAVTALAAAIASFALRFGNGLIFWEFVCSSLLLSAVALSGGLWTTLLLRQVAPAMLFAICIPFMLTLGLVGLLVGNVSDTTGMIWLMSILAVYSVAGFAGAQRLFGNAQDQGWVSEVISPWQLTKRSRTREEGVVRHQPGPLRALIQKEFQLQQVTLIVAAAMAGLHVVDLLARKFYLQQLPEIRSILEVVPLLWLLLPLVAGGVVMAEERKLGTMEAQLCAPVSRRMQFVLKLIMALGLGLLLGAGAPLFFEWLGHMAGVVGGTDQLTVQGNLTSISSVLTWDALAISLIAFLASSLSRNTLQAMGAAVVMSVVFMPFTDLASHPMEFEDRPLWGIPLADSIGIPATVLAALILAWKNFGHLHFGAKIWRRNIGVLLTTWLATLALDGAIYNRVWESFMPEEPSHRWLPKFKPAPGTTRIVANWGALGIVTQDGRLRLGAKTGNFVAGNDWKAVAVCDSNSYAMKTDGSLWDVTAAPTPFLSGSKWRDIVSQNRKFVALKADGTIWQWGRHWVKREDVALAPEEVGSDTNWVSICASRWTAAAAKADGSIWVWVNVPLSNSTNLVRTPEKWLDIHSHKIVSMSINYGSLYTVASDHTLWKDNQRLGTDSDWAEVAAAWNGVAALLKTDGTFWIIQQTERAGETHYAQTEMSGYYDWTSVGWGDWTQTLDGGYVSLLSLAADGKLCRWHMPFPEHSPWSDKWPRSEQWLAPSRLHAVTVADLHLDSN